jgi:hypothetical protein
VVVGAVLPGSGSPEHQATLAVPQPTDNPDSASRRLAELLEENTAEALAAEMTFRFQDFFNTHSRLRSRPHNECSAGYIN